MFTEEEQAYLKDLAEKTRHLAGQMDTISTIGPNFEVAVVDIMDDMREALKGLDNALRLLQQAKIQI